MRRKPVPPLLPMPKNHPFATASITSGSPSKSGGSLYQTSSTMGRQRSESPVTPGISRLEEDLFFKPTLRNQNVGNASPQRAGTPSTIRSSHTLSATDPTTTTGMKDAMGSRKRDTFHGGSSVGSNDSRSEISEYVDVDVEDQPPLSPATPPIGRSSPTPEETPTPRIHTPMALTVEVPSADLGIATSNKFWEMSETNSKERIITQSTTSTPVLEARQKVDTESRSSTPHGSAPGTTPGTPNGSVGGLKTPFFLRKNKSSPAKGLEEEQDDPTPEPFSVDTPPSQRRIWEAATTFLRDEEGNLVCFGDLFPQSPPIAPASSVVTDGPAPKPITKFIPIFIRHFLCGQCQDYAAASVSLLDPVACEQAGVRVVVISNGSWKIIKSYRKLFGCRFPIYVDGPRRLYQLMG